MNYKNEFTSDGEYVTMFIPVKTCNICESKMVLKEKRPSIFSRHIVMTQDAQVKRLELKYQHAYDLLGMNLICEECFQSGSSTFKCSLCNETKTTDRIKESIGYLPSDYLCIDCYTTVPAKVWDEKLDELLEDHKYDYE